MFSGLFDREINGLWIIHKSKMAAMFSHSTFLCNFFLFFPLNLYNYFYFRHGTTISSTNIRCYATKHNGQWHWYWPLCSQLQCNTWTFWWNHGHDAWPKCHDILRIQTQLPFNPFPWLSYLSCILPPICPAPTPLWLARFG